MKGSMFCWVEANSSSGRLLLMAVVVLEFTALNRDGMKFEAQISAESGQTGGSIRPPNANSDLE